jgi:hypothetical protein
MRTLTVLSYVLPCGVASPGNIGTNHNVIIDISH